MTNLLTALGITKKTWIEQNVTPAQEITQADSWGYGLGGTTISTLLGGVGREARQRDLIYQKWSLMEADPLCSTAIKLLVTTALGGDEDTGQSVFIEKAPVCADNKQLDKIADEIINDLTTIFNRVAFSMGYVGAVFGDAFARVYCDDTGVVDLSTDEMYRPPMIQPFVRGSRTVGFGVYVGPKLYEKLTIEQLVRLEIPRSQWVPQPSVMQKSLKMAVLEDDIDNLPILPAMVGGSFLYAAEPSWDKLVSGLSSMSAQRLRDAIDEAYMTVNMDSMTKDQQDRMKLSVVEMVTKTKGIIDSAIATGSPFNSLIRHIIPVNNEKQVTNITPMGSSRSATISTDDIMFYARQTAAAIGPDLSMLGFSDQIGAGMFGDGGLSTTSATITEHSRIIRHSLKAFFHKVLDVHCIRRYGVAFADINCPVRIRFYGSIAAFDAQKQRTEGDAVNSAMMKAQGMQLIRDLGLSKESMKLFMSRQMLMDEEEAGAYAEDLSKAPPADDGSGGFGGNNNNMTGNEGSKNEETD